MNKLDELIKALCPDGVEYIPISDLSRAITPKIKIKSNDYLTDGIYPIIDQGQDFIGGYTNNEDVFPKDEYIIFGDHTCVVKFVDFSFAQGADGVKVLKVNSPTILPKYLFYCMDNIKMDSSYARHWSKMKAIKIPIPHTDIQREIINILDSFTELTAELTARKQQYEYYRDRLLSFENEQSGDDIPRVELRSVVKKHCAGATPKKGNAAYYEGGNIPWIRTQDVKFNEIYEVDSFITEEAVKRTAVKWIPKNCVIVVISGASAGRCAVNKIRATTNQHCLNMEIDEEKALYQYVYYCVSARYDELVAKKQGARGDLNSTLILETKIPMPPIKTQKQIVDKIDAFNVLLNDLASGLPAEIAARQQQYEYYRDKLLTFTEK